jgi:hypothetical protein
LLVSKERSRFKKALLIAAGVLVLFFLVTGAYGLAFYSQVKETQRGTA